MPTITALREDRRGRVAVELDGAPWRTVPVAVVVRAGLSEGRPLDRPALRTLRRELRRAEALAVAGRALRARDMSRARLSARLEGAAVAPAAAEASLGTLESAGVLDDERFARARAESLAGRGYGDAAIRHDLEGQGLAGDVVERALDALEPEPERARQARRAPRAGRPNGAVSGGKRVRAGVLRGRARARPLQLRPERG